jgi:hypothetical protein
MNVCRTVLALLIALSVAMLPRGGGVGAAAKSMTMSGMTESNMAEMSAMGDMDCCPHQSIPSDKSIDGCSCMATCALNCFSFTGTAATVVFSSPAAKLLPAFETNAFTSHKGSPPFRPPRV